MADDFREALRRLASDNAYRLQATNDPKSILADFNLKKHDIEALRSAAIMSGADLTEVDKLLAKPGVANYPLGADMLMDNGCCCCCCCCGDTGHEIMVSAP